MPDTQSKTQLTSLALPEGVEVTNGGESLVVRAEDGDSKVAIQCGMEDIADLTVIDTLSEVSVGEELEFTAESGSGYGRVTDREPLEDGSGEIIYLRDLESDTLDRFCLRVFDHNSPTADHMVYEPDTQSYDHLALGGVTDATVTSGTDA